MDNESKQHQKPTNSQHQQNAIFELKIIPILSHSIETHKGAM
jgi:hypothetical protein